MQQSINTKEIWESIKIVNIASKQHTFIFLMNSTIVIY